MARYHIQHITIYSYQHPVAVSHHSARLKPLSNAEQTAQNFRLKIEPENTDLDAQTDYFGNALHLFSIQKTHDILKVTAESEVDIHPQVVDLNKMTLTCGALRQILANVKNAHLIDAKQFMYPTEMTPDIEEAIAFGMRFLKDETPIGEAIEAILEAFQNEFQFDPEATEISTPVGEVFNTRRGVCQDFAHAMIASLRACGLSARYASGYILTHPPEGTERLVGADASHAWVSVFIPETGWVDVDPTNNLICGEEHARVAYGRDYSDVSMLKGAVTGGGEHKITVKVTMEPIT